MPRQPFFNQWCDVTQHAVGTHTVRVLKEKADARQLILPHLDTAVLDNYDDLERLQRWAAQMGLPSAAAVLRDDVPVELRARSGHVGEILLTESVPELFPDFLVPIKRLRWKDGRNMALRGEDFIGINIQERPVQFIKAEAKSRGRLYGSTVEEARAALDSNRGRPSACAMLYIARRLDELGQAALSATFLEYALKQAPEETQLVHVLFTFSGNDGSDLLRADIAGYQGQIRQQSVGLIVTDHQDFIVGIYTRLANAAQH